MSKIKNPSHLNKVINHLEYCQAVSSLVKFAKKDCGGSRVCAQVLLSAYNGNNYQLSVTDLGLLDDELYQSAITVIRGRTELRMEPHECLNDGDSIFAKLCEQWFGYHISKRHTNGQNFPLAIA